MYKAYNTIEYRLLEEKCELYLELKRKSVDELGLPIKLTRSTISFGHILDFSMFWIKNSDGTLCFMARKKFTRTRTDNTVKIPFLEENQQAIFEAIDNIYNDYIEATKNGAFEQEVQRIETKRSRRSAYRKNKYIGTDIQLLWNDVMVNIFEKAEQIIEGDTSIEEISEESKTYVQRFFELSEDILHIMMSKHYSGYIKRIGIYYDYIESDSVTYREIASKYSLSRQGIYDSVRRVSNNLNSYFKRAMLFDDDEINDRIKELASIIEKLDHNMISSCTYGAQIINDRKKQALFCMLFGNDLSQKFIDHSNTVLRRNQSQDIQAKNAANLIQAWEEYRSKICYPSDIVADPNVYIRPFFPDITYSAEENFLKKLKKFESIIEILQTPDIVYYSNDRTFHRPHFLLRLPDGTQVLVVVTQTINMALCYNIKRFNALHLYCKKHGYGYLITDNQENSIYDIKSRVLDTELCERLNDILDEKGIINWKDIKEIKLSRTVSNADIAAYVLQNKLHFNLQPFLIKRK